MDLHQVRTVLLDIEGTICPITFVKDVLFPYALSALPDVLAQKWDDPEFTAYRDAFPDDAKASPEAMEAHVQDLSARDVKVAYLKNLQGYLWRTGYESHAYTTPLFPDVVPRLQDWHEAGIQLVVFSSGSVAAQKLLFQHVGVDGDWETTGLAKIDDEKDLNLSPKKRKLDPSESLSRLVKARKTDVKDDSKVRSYHRNEVTYGHENGSNEDDKKEEGAIAENGTAERGDNDAKEKKGEKRADEVVGKVETVKDSEPTAQKTPQPTIQDLTHLFSAFFDTVNAGPKTEEDSYFKIAAELGRECEEVLFLSDNVHEIRASLLTKMPSILVTRPGNAPLSDADKVGISIISSLVEVQGLPTAEKE